jgi:hypothetical protein
MISFQSIRELLVTLGQEQKLVSELFGKRNILSFNAVDTPDAVDAERINWLIAHGVLNRKEGRLTLDEQYVHFFEQVLEVNEDLSVSAALDYIDCVCQNFRYYKCEKIPARKDFYLNVIKKHLYKAGWVVQRGLADLIRSTETVVKNELNAEVRRLKLEFLDKKRADIINLSNDISLILAAEEADIKLTFDEELIRIVTAMKNQMNGARMQLESVQLQIIDYLNQLHYQQNMAEKIRQIKYLKDQFELESKTNICSLLAENTATVFAPKVFYPLKISIDWLQTDSEAVSLIYKVSGASHAGGRSFLRQADGVESEYLTPHDQPDYVLNLPEIHEQFMRSNDNLFSFVMNYSFKHPVSEQERITLYCRLISEYETEFDISERTGDFHGMEYAMVFPRQVELTRI